MTVKENEISVAIKALSGEPFMPGMRINAEISIDTMPQSKFDALSALIIMKAQGKVGLVVGECDNMLTEPAQDTKIRKEITAMSLSDLIIDLNDAKTPDDEKKAYANFRGRMGNKPSDAEVLTAFMRDCTDMAGKPLLQADEYADLAGGKVEVKKETQPIPEKRFMPRAASRL